MNSVDAQSMNWLLRHGVTCVVLAASGSSICNPESFSPANDFQCMGLSNAKGATNATSCFDACCAIDSCAVWNWCGSGSCGGGKGGGCWIGASTNCVSDACPFLSRRH